MTLWDMGQVQQWATGIAGDELAEKLKTKGVKVQLESLSLLISSSLFSPSLLQITHDLPSSFLLTNKTGKEAD